MSSIPTDPVVAKWLFKILEGLERRSGLTPTACVGTQYVQHVENCSWQISDLSFRLFIRPEIPMPVSRSPAAAALFRLELYLIDDFASYVTSWRYTTHSIDGFGPTLDNFLDAVWERTRLARIARARHHRDK